MTVITPTIVSFSPDTGALTGNPQLTDANVLTLTGTAAANSTVEIFNGSTLLGAAATNASGAWSFTTPTLGTGFFGVSLTAVDTDSTGAKSSASAPLNLTVDTLAPATPVITSFSPDTGTAGDQTTAQVLTLTGAVGEVDGFVQIYDNGTLLGQATINLANGTWTFHTGTLASGTTHDFTATFTNWAGNTSAASAALDVAIVPPPAPPTITSVSPDTGVVGVTDATILTLTGTAAANITLDIYDGGTLLGQTTANAGGLWSFKTGQLANGVQNFTAVTVDRAGNPSQPSAAASMTIDTHIPTAPVIATETVGAANVVTLTGTAEASDAIMVYDGTILLGETVANAAGAWSFIAGTLSVGAHNLSATATDLAGATSASSGDPVVTITSSSAPAPNAPVILSASPDSGPVSNLTTTSNELTLTGTGAANTTITVFDGASQVGTTTTNAHGVWTFTTASVLADGAHGFTATATNASGAESAQSATLSITVQPDIGSFSPLTDQWSNPISIDGSPFYVENANVNGNAPWAITQTNPQTLRFVLDPGDYWADNDSHRTEVADATIYAPTATITTSYQFMVEPGPTNNYWTVLGQFHSDDNSPITQGLTADYPVFAVELTGPGGVGQGDHLAIWADYALAGQTTPTAITPSGGSSFGFLYVAPTPIVRGEYYSVTIEANFQNNSNGFLEVWLNGAEIVDYHGPIGYGAGNYWKEGIYQDPSNTTQTIAADYKNLVISDTPGAPLILSDTVNGDHVVLSGDAQANSTVTVFDGATKLGATTVNSSGSWTYESGQLSLGAHALTVTATNSGGNVSAASNVSDTTITSLTTAVVTDVAASVPSGEETVGETVTFTLDMSAAVKVTGTPTLALNDGGIATYSGGSGTSALTFSYTIGPSDNTTSALSIIGVNLPSGSTVIDASGNSASFVGAAVSFAHLAVDLTPVQTPSFANSSANANGTFTLNGVAGANTTVTIYDDGNILGTAAVNQSGAWTFTTPTMANNTWNGFTAVDTNSLGDASATASGPGYGENTTLPTSPEITGNAVTSNEVTLYGTVGANTTVQVFDGATLLGATTANSSGLWSFTTGALSNGVHAFTATATNASGTSGASEPTDLTIGATNAPPVPAIASFSPDTGTAGDGVTDAQTISLTGTAAANTTVTVYDGSTKLGTATAGATGAWTFTTGQLSTGAHQFTATDADAYGDVSTASSALSVTVVAPPPVPAIASFSPDTGTAGDGVTDAQTISLTGTAAANTTVTVYDGSTKLGTATAGATGAWTFTTGQLSTGAHQFTATDADAYGDVSAASSALSVTIDTLAQQPTLTNLVHNSNGTATLSGVSEPLSTVSIYEDGGTIPLGTVTTSANGIWSFTSSSLSNIMHAFSVTADVAGNVGVSANVGLYGTTGTNTLLGGPGLVMSGGPGSDAFVFHAGWGPDIVTDFQAQGSNHDVLEFGHQTIFQNFATVLTYAAQVGSNVVITAIGADTITLLNVQKKSLIASDFHFV